ncbi:unnamed protein product [Calypogeia fissa]
MASAVRRSLQSSRLWPLIASKEVARQPISTVSATMQDQQPVITTEEKTIEAEPIDIPTPNDRTKLLVLGGNGYVGSHVCKEALERGLPVLSLNRSGKPSVEEPWVKEVDWIRASVFDTEKWKDHLKEVTAVISCIGGFGSNSQMVKINGDANICAINASAEAGVERFVFISAADFNLPFVLKGYYEGKKAAEEALRAKFPYGGVILRPGFIHGTRRVGNISIPLSAVGAPLEMLFRNIKPASQLPVIGPLLIPPVKATAVAKAAVRAAVDNAVPPGALDVWGIIRLGDHK